LTKLNRKTINESNLHAELLHLHDQLRRKMVRDWNRILPFEELLFNRWEKADFLKANEGSSIYHNNYIFGKVIIGKKTWIGPFTLLDGSGGTLKIGDYCSISSGVQIYTHNTVKWALTGGKASYEKNRTTIGNFCYLGPYSLVTMGVKIGKCSVIGAHSLVNRDIPSYSIAFGIPAKVVGKVKIKGQDVKFHYFKKPDNDTDSSSGHR
jgi:acetyltransferase-like isoleucine patch superfamily enzyme